MTTPHRDARPVPAPVPAADARAGMQLISRASAVLQALEGQLTGLSLGQIAGVTGLPRPTVQRLVDALCAEGFALVDPQQGGVRLGPLIARLAGSVRIDLVALARPYLERLAWKTQESAAMTTLQDGKVVVLAIVTPPARAIQLTASVGSHWPLHSSAEGKALLSGLPEDAIRAMLPPALEARTPRTTTSVLGLLAEIQEAAGHGVAVDEEGTATGISALAARLVDGTGRRYALSLLLPASRFNALAGELRSALLECRAAVLTAAGLPPMPSPEGFTE